LIKIAQKTGKLQLPTGALPHTNSTQATAQLRGRGEPKR